MSSDHADREGFVHRANKDGTFDSFCRACLRTVATGNGEADLEPFERQHVCNPYEAARFKLPDREYDDETESRSRPWLRDSA